MRLLLCLIVLSLMGCQQQQPPSVVRATPTPGVTALALDQLKLGEQPLTLEAAWEQSDVADLGALMQTEEFGGVLRGLHPAEETRRYSSADFQQLFPEHSVAVGDVWPVPDALVLKLLGQFDSQVVTKLNMDGVGSYALLRAVSQDKAEIALRLHAQFQLEGQLFYTPAAFLGSLTVNRDGAVESLELAVPTEHSRNLGFEIHGSQHYVGLGFLNEMALKGQAEIQLSSDGWLEEISPDRANEELRSKFDAFHDIPWAPVETVLKKAKEQDRPIFAIVIEGVLDDQSC